MNKTIIKGMLLSALTSAFIWGATSCKNYDDDIYNLQNEVDVVKVSLEQLQSRFGNGTYITNVTPSANGGVLITLNTGEVLAVGGESQASHSWTIGPDGFWYDNGEKTSYRAIGEKGDKGDKGDQGEKGEQGEQGEQGIPGTDGKSTSIYYVPNEETLCWDIWEDGYFKSHTDISWRASAPDLSMTSFFDGTTLTLMGVDTGAVDADGNPITTNVRIKVGVSVGSLEFIPSAVSSVVPYPTNEAPFYFITSYISETNYRAGTREFSELNGMNKSNLVELAYRVNPSDAFVYEYAQAEFINRGVVSRAAGDNGNLLNVKTRDVEVDGTQYTKYFDINNNGELFVRATLNPANRINGRHDIAALKLKNGQANWTVSDYIHLAATEIKAELVDSATMRSTNGIHRFYNRTKALPNPSEENDNFVKQFVPIDAAANHKLMYSGTLDLKKLPGLYCTDMRRYLTELGIYGMKYKFSLPAEYKANDIQGTNQQWFVKIDENDILSVNEEHLTEGLTPAIGRTPIVRVDAFLADNFDRDVLVASAYIKIEITNEPPTNPDIKDDITHNLPAKEYEYHSLHTPTTLINQMNWQDVNNIIYGTSGLSSNSFWDYYGGENDEYTVTITTIAKDNSIVPIARATARANSTYLFNLLDDHGIYCETTLGSGNTETSNIKFCVNNKVKTQNTYKDVDGKGACYTVKILIPSDDITKRGDVVVTQEFYVKEICQPYDFNPNYYAGTVDGKDNVVITKGKLINGEWKLELSISEVFKMINGQNIFSYFNQVNNAQSIEFSLDPAYQRGISFTQSNDNILVALTEPLTTSSLFASMKYDVILVNGEKCTFYFNIQFLNPFVAGNANRVTINGNATGSVSVETAPQVLVNDVDGNAIYRWMGSSLQLTSLAKNTYRVSEPTVTYDFVRDNDYYTFAGNLDPAATFSIDHNTGRITYNNLGATLIPSYNLKVEAVVTFANLSQVKCIIPVLVQGRN